MIKFKISSIDSLGQGVSKEDDKIVFIPKTLEGETGTARIHTAKKNISFAKMIDINKASKDRISSACPHYKDCGGCHYLHTSYINEMKLKENSLKEIFSRHHKIEISDILTSVSANQRDSYRNRIQLHYSIPNQEIGFYSDATPKRIIPIQDCILPVNEVKSVLKDLYRENKWKKLKLNKKQGHIELYFKDKEVHTNINKRYSHEGFSQVNEFMNNELLKMIETQVKDHLSENDFLVDLFGGSGNLSISAKCETLVIDSTPQKHINLGNSNQKYMEVDLYADKAHQIIESRVKKDPKLLLIDPPRSGLKNIKQFTDVLRPEKIIYVSCNPQTLARDVKSIEDKYKLEDLFIYDFFPGTKHYETVASLSLR